MQTKVSFIWPSKSRYFFFLNQVSLSPTLTIHRTARKGERISVLLFIISARSRTFYLHYICLLFLFAAHVITRLLIDVYPHLRISIRLNVNPFYVTSFFYTPWKDQKTRGFLMFSGVSEKTSGMKCVNWIWFVDVMADNITSKFLKTVFHKFCLVHSWIPWFIYMLADINFSFVNCRFELVSWIYILRSSHRTCSIKKGVLKISQNSQEDTCPRVSFLIKLQG